MTRPFLSRHWHRVATLTPGLKPHASFDVHVYRGRLWYVLHDAASNRVHRFTAPAFAVIGAMDGATPLETIWREVSERLGAQAPTQDDILALLSQLHQQDLLATGIPPDMDEMFERRERGERQKRARSFHNPLAITVPLADPDRWLTGLVRAFRWLDRRVVLALWAACVLPAVVAAGLHWQALTGNLSDQVLSAHNLALLAVLFPVAKLLHELGHGIAAKAAGAAVNEVGVMVLVLFPTPYVDVSGAQALPDRRARMLIGAAGMMAELWLASLALLVWFHVDDGLVRAIAFNLVLIAGVSSLLFNGNPLMRFDAYFILCDALDLPNLGGRANRWWGEKALTLLVGRRHLRPQPVTGGEAALFLAYAPAAYLYRLVVLLGIALFVAEQYLLAGLLAAAWSLVMGVLLPLGRTLKQLIQHPGFTERRGRAVALLAGPALALAAGLVLVPLPHATTTEGVVWLPDDAQVRATGEGVVERVLVEPGTRVSPGMALLEVRDIFGETERQVQRRRVAEIEARLFAEQFRDPAQAALLRSELESARALEARLARRAARATLRAGAEGLLVLPRPGALVGRHLREGELVGHIVPEPVPGAATQPGLIRALVSQADIDLVRNRLTGVEARLVDHPTLTLPAQVLRSAGGAERRLPSAALGLPAGGPFAPDPRDPDGLALLDPAFVFDLATRLPAGTVGYGGRALVRFSLTPEPLARQAGRRLRQLVLGRLDV